MNNQGQELSFSQAVSGPKWQKMMLETLGDPKKKDRFVTAISSAVATNPKLAECDHGSIFVAGLLGEALNLSPSPQMGQYYLVPYNDKKAEKPKATFQLGYKGYVQLALRSGNYKKLNVVEVKEGELISYNQFTEELKVSAIEDPAQREAMETIGYYAYFELLIGFHKSMYWSREKVEHHAKTYSQSYGSRNAWAVENSFWTKNFDAMAMKTMLRQLISKWGPISIDMEKAFLAEEQGAEIQVEHGTVQVVHTAEAFPAYTPPQAEIPQVSQDFYPKENQEPYFDEPYPGQTELVDLKTMQ